MSSRSSKLPQWAEKIGQFRVRLNLSQAELGARLRYSAMAVSRWERGVLEPTAEVYIRLGNLAGEPDCWFFWERAGLRKSDLLRLLPHVSRQTAPAPVEIATSNQAAKKIRSKASRLFAIPVLDIHASGSGDEGDRVTDFSRLPAQELIATSATWCPNPATSACLHVEGNSMSPLIKNGDLVAFDYSQTCAEELNGEIVIASHRKRGLTISRFRKYLDVELLEPDNRDYDPIQISKDRNWRIVGKALWWIRKAP